MRSALSGSGRLTGGAGLPAEVGVQARYKRLAVTHATTVGEIPIKSIGFIDKVRTGCTGRRVPEARLLGVLKPGSQEF
jgi:hypothetical protein